MAQGSRRVIVAVDASEASANAVTWAVDNFLKKSDRVLVLNSQPFASSQDIPALDFAGGGEYAVPIQPDEMEDKERAEKAKDVVDHFMRQLAAAGITCEGEVIRGDPGAHICSEAGRILADAVVVGTKDYGLLKRTLVGSISDSVLRNSPAPVVLVRMGENSEAAASLGHKVESRNVVVAVDGGPESAHAYKWALSHLCRDDTDTLILLNVVDTSTGTSALAADQVAVDEVVLPLADDSKAAVASLSASEKLVEQYMKYTEDKTKIKCEGRVLSGPLEERINEELTKLKAHVVVVGWHESSSLVKTVLGSVSEYLCHNSPCPVVVAKVVPRFNDVAEPTTGKTE